MAGSRVRVKLESGVRLRDARPVRSGVFLSGLYACWEVYRYYLSWKPSGSSGREVRG